MISEYEYGGIRPGDIILIDTKKYDWVDSIRYITIMVELVIRKYTASGGHIIISHGRTTYMEDVICTEGDLCDGCLVRGTCRKKYHMRNCYLERAIRRLTSNTKY